MTGSDRLGDDAVDHEALVAEIEAEARRLRESGEVDDALLAELDRVFESLVPDETGERDFASALDRAERESLIDVHPPADSRLPGGAPVKRAVKKLVLWYVDFVAGQVTNMAGSLTRAVRLLGDRVDDVDERLEALGLRHQTLRAEVRSPAPDAALATPGADPAAAWAGAICDALAASGGRVVHADCGDGTLVARLVETGVDAYGTDPLAPETPARAADGAADLRSSSAVDHLMEVSPGGLGAVVLSGFVDRATLGERREAVTRAADVLAPGGRLFVVGSDPATWLESRSVVETDLAPGRPLHAETWKALIEAAGLDDVTVASNLPADAPADAPASFLVSAVKGGSAIP